MVRAGTTLAGRYRLEQRIASGGMGEVWRGFDRVLGRTVAVKCLLPAPPDEPFFVERFRDEARTMATISHAGVVEVYDFGDDPAAGVYLVMKFIDGESLAHTLARTGRLSPEATMRVVAEAAEALHAAHDQGVTHRDVKPGNLLLCPDGSALLTDFGIASSSNSPRVNGHTSTGLLVGTAGYMAPERANGHPATARSDIYSLGVVAYRCLAGHMPFDGDSPVEIAMRHVYDDPAPLPADVPPRVRAVVERAMAKDPAERWPSGAVFAVEARRALEVAPPTVVQPVRGRRRANRLLVPVGVVVAAIAAVSFLLSRPDDPQPQSLRDNPAASAASPAGNVGATDAPPSVGAISPVPSATKPKAGNGTTAPAAPKGLTATPVDAGTIRLRWTDASSDEDGFTITNGVTSHNVGANATVHDWTGLPPATRSCFKIHSYNSSGPSGYYPAAAADWVCATSLPGTGPAAPTGLTATALNATTIRLQWTDQSSDEDGFTITNGVTSRNVGAGVTTYHWDGLLPGTYSCFKVRAHNASGVSAYNPAAEREWVCVTTPVY